MQHDEPVPDTVAEAFPPVHSLPAEDAREFAAELAESLRTTTSIAPHLQLITEWRHTAAVHADPELAARLARDLDQTG